MYQKQCNDVDEKHPQQGLFLFAILPLNVRGLRGSDDLGDGALKNDGVVTAKAFIQNFLFELLEHSKGLLPIFP